MRVLVLTVLLSLILVTFFLILFLATRRGEQFGGAERQSLLPLEDENETLKQGYDEPKASTSHSPRLDSSKQLRDDRSLPLR